MPRLDSIPCECTCQECGAVCSPTKPSRMCGQCQNRMNKTVQRGVYNDPKHWPPDWIATLLNVPLLGREPFERPEWVPETNPLATRLEEEEEEADPDNVAYEDYAPMYSEQPNPEDDQDNLEYIGDQYIGADLTEPTERPAAPATPVAAAAPPAPLYVREPALEPVATISAPESLPSFNSPQDRLGSAREEVRQLSAQLFELEADAEHLPANGVKKGNWLARFLTWLTGVKRVRGAKQ